MRTLLSSARGFVDAYLPGVGHLYRILRDERRATRNFVTTRFGFRFTGNESMSTGAFENDEVEVFLKYLDRSSLCIDIGANVGLYSHLAASRGKQVIAIEPSKTNLRVLYSNLVENEFLEVEVFPLGLSSKGGLKRLFGDGTGASFVPGWAATSQRYFQVVPVTTLDIIASERVNAQPTFIKMDVEGFENEVLKGAQRILGANPRPTWLVEICLNEHFPGGLNQQFQETFEFFWQHGYESFVADSEQRLVTRENVRRWSEQGHVEFGSHNYLFM